MKIRMKQDAKGAVDGGKTTMTFLAGQEYDVEVSLGVVFVNLDYAEMLKEVVESKSEEPKVEAKTKGKK